MAYNKAREERKWQLWKEAEEKKLRTLGTSEDTIEKLRVHDWEIFKSERRYYEKLQDAGTYLDEIAANTVTPEIKTIEDFLNSIEDERLYQLFLTVDKLTLEITLMKIQGYSAAEIATKLGLTSKSVYRKMDRLKEKIKKNYK